MILSIVMEYFYQGIGKRIRQSREAKEYTQEELAAFIDLDKNVLIAFEEGRMRIFIDYISKLAEVLGVTTDYLIYGNKKQKNKLH